MKATLTPTFLPPNPRLLFAQVASAKAKAANLQAPTRKGNRLLPPQANTNHDITQISDLSSSPPATEPRAAQNFPHPTKVPSGRKTSKDPLTMMTIELHVETRANFRPDPK
jgi:hypothetical protein